MQTQAVVCREVTENKPGLHWLLLTSESLTCLEDALKVVEYYQCRWKIEEFHKAWKSGGTQVEKLRMQYGENIEKVATILAFVALRLLQLREQGEDHRGTLRPCTDWLTPLQWKLLWRRVEKQKRFPSTPPSIRWAYESLGQLGGWHDSKRTGRVGWNALWEGWFKLDMLVEGYELRLELEM